ncbi:hypothetical protein K443DRAFT_162745 [Laccaria amethystina LaAM-08-1]|uniref:Uncharacterized protein n=1 Tax=Laccaria amethystina LaAM-08-1 TaxID=1095629 RepID=A0A0C9XUL2_9AGAR|nr:hypothetical protein K443DRAFT_162745 [Laccaria amethystina LaAM-08-1]
MILKMNYKSRLYSQKITRKPAGPNDVDTATQPPHMKRQTANFTLSTTADRIDPSHFRPAIFVPSVLHPCIPSPHSPQHTHAWNRATPVFMAGRRDAKDRRPQNLSFPNCTLAKGIEEGRRTGAMVGSARESGCSVRLGVDYKGPSRVPRMLRRDGPFPENVGPEWQGRWTLGVDSTCLVLEHRSTRERVA